MSSQSDWIYNKEPIKFLVYVAGNVTRCFYLFVSNGVTIRLYREANLVRSLNIVLKILNVQVYSQQRV